MSTVLIRPTVYDIQPIRAIVAEMLSSEGTPEIRTDTCIRGHCCREVCSHAAILAKTPLASSIIEWMRSKR